jgi:hypothetical protein
MKRLISIAVFLGIMFSIGNVFSFPRITNLDPPRIGISLQDPSRSIVISLGPSKIKLNEVEYYFFMLKPNKGFKIAWAPIKLRFNPKPERVLIEYGLYEKSDFVYDLGSAAIMIPFVGKHTGQQIVKANLFYSVCDKMGCYFERSDIQLTIDVVP